MAALFARFERFAALPIKLRDAIMPPTCAACDRQVATSGGVCPGCWSQMRFLESPMVVEKRSAFQSCRSAVAYDGPARRMAQAFKFADRTDLAPTLAQWMVRAAIDLETGYVVLPVPLHRNRLLRRRFNQAAELARHVAAATGHAYLPDTLLRTRATRQQVGLKAGERHANVRGAFRVPEAKAITIKGRSVLLIDDVYTTGATLEACSRALLRAGAAQVDCLTFARVLDGPDMDDLYMDETG